MDKAVLSLLVFIFAIGLSSICRINLGVIAILSAYVVGVLLYRLAPATIIGYFPWELFVILTGMTLLFAQIQQNGTLDRLSAYLLSVAGANRALIPVFFFLGTCVLSTIGPGNIVATALMAPVAMKISRETGLSPFITTIMIANGANAGGLSPFAPAGIITNRLALEIGLAPLSWALYRNSLIIHSLIAFGAYLLFVGLRWRKLFGGKRRGMQQSPRLTSLDYVTLAAIGLLIAGVVGFQFHLGYGAFLLALALTISGKGDIVKVCRDMPWGIIIMVCGVTVLIGTVTALGGMDLAVSLLARFATPSTAPAVLGFITGAVSVYTSSSGVVIPTFVPMVPGLVAAMGGGNPAELVSAIAVGTHLVDVSPLSTLGALCLTAAHGDRSRLFWLLFFWGQAMSVVGALVCWILFR